MKQLIALAMMICVAGTTVWADEPPRELKEMIDVVWRGLRPDAV